jgi:hypothetical protein
VRLEALPLKLELCRTHLAAGEDAAWMRRRFRTACAALGTTVEEAADRLVIAWPQIAPAPDASAAGRGRRGRGAQLGR